MNASLRESEESTDEDTAMRRLTLTRMLVWAAQEARDIGCPRSAGHVELALDAIAVSIREKMAGRGH